jgi:hypothetical protein
MKNENTLSKFEPFVEQDPFDAAYIFVCNLNCIVCFPYF